MRLWERAWVAGVAALVAFTGFGVLPDLWPFQRWTMFSAPGPETSDLLVAVAIDDAGGREVHHGERLPGGFLRDGYQHRFERSAPAQRSADCRRMLADLRDADPHVDGLVIEHWEWELLARDGHEPAQVEREAVWRCDR